MNQKHSFITVKDGNTGESVYLIRLRGDSYFESKIKFQLKNTYMYLVLLWCKIVAVNILITIPIISSNLDCISHQILFGNEFY